MNGGWSVVACNEWGWLLKQKQKPAIAKTIITITNDK